jgi:hypothetical protein
MQITVQPGVPGTTNCDGQIGCWTGIARGPKSINGIWANGSVGGRPWMLSGSPSAE